MVYPLVVVVVVALVVLAVVAVVVDWEEEEEATIIWIIHMVPVPCLMGEVVKIFLVMAMVWEDP